MRKFTTAAVATAGILGGALGTTVIAPGLAAAVTGASGEVVAERVAEIRDALAGLVDDGSITQEQADEVAETLSDSDVGWGHGRGPGGGHGPGHLDPDTLAKILGITADELRTAVEEGQTLAQIAAEQGMARADLLDELVAAAENELTDEVDEGDLTQEQADELMNQLEDRIVEEIDEVPGHHHGRFGDHGSS